MNVSSSLVTDSTHIATNIIFDGLITPNAQIQLDDIVLNDQPCSPSKIICKIEMRHSNRNLNFLEPKKLKKRRKLLR